MEVRVRWGEEGREERKERETDRPTDCTRDQNGACSGRKSELRRGRGVCIGVTSCGPESHFAFLDSGFCTRKTEMVTVLLLSWVVKIRW